MAQLTNEELLKSLKEIFEKLQAKESEIQAILPLQLSAAEKWQKLLEIFLPAEIEVISNHGFAKDQVGLALYNQQLMTQAKKGTELHNLFIMMWEYLFKKAYGFESVRELPLDEAEQIVREMAQAGTENAFLEKVESEVGSLPENTDIMERRNKLVALTTPLHMEIFKKHGFTGEEGYIQMQRALMDHYHVPRLVQMAAHSQLILFRKAGLFNKGPK